MLEFNKKQTVFCFGFFFNELYFFTELQCILCNLFMNLHFLQWEKSLLNLQPAAARINAGMCLRPPK